MYTFQGDGCAHKLEIDHFVSIKDNRGHAPAMQSKHPTLMTENMSGSVLHEMTVVHITRPYSRTYTGDANMEMYGSLTAPSLHNLINLFFRYGPEQPNVAKKEQIKEKDELTRVYGKI